MVLIISGCANDIHLFPEEVPSEYMVFGILDANSEDQFIKIRKTFGGNMSLNEMAGEPEMFLPPDSISVRVEEWTDDGIIFHPFEMQVLEKESGIFSELNNHIHYGKFGLEDGRKYGLRILDEESNIEITASTIAIDPPDLRFPTTGNTKYRFADTVNHFYVKYAPTGAVHLQQFFINYVDILKNGDTLFRTAKHELRPRFRHPEYPVVTYTRTYSKDYVVNIFRMIIEEDENVRERQLYSFDFLVWAGDEYLKDYLQLAEKFNDHRRQYFTNIEGGMGIFAACSHSGVDGIYPRQAFFDTLANAERLINHKFSNIRFRGDFVKGDVSFPEFGRAKDNQYNLLEYQGN